MLRAPSESPALFFNRLATTAGMPDTTGGLGINALHFGATAPDGHAAEAADLGQVLDAAVAPLECEQTNEAPAVFLIQSCDDTIDGLMFLRHRARWMSLTGFAKTLMNFRFLSVFHWYSSLRSSRQE
jgi:hypothetical protein